MAATRFHHFGSAVNLPDASLAVFFLGGLYGLGTPWFVAFLVEAGLIDATAVAGGISSFCVTPAYVFLIPTYGALWFAGRWFRARHRISARTLPLLALTMLTATAVAFLISNGSFYALAGYFEKMSLGEYAAKTAQYYVPYASYAFLYVALALGLHALIAAARHRAEAAA
jgi:hypothetical protein